MSALDDFLKDGEAVQAGLQQPTPAAAVRKPLQPPEPLSFMDKMLAKVPSELVNNPATAATRTLVTNAAAPAIAATQAVANAFPDSTGVPQMYNQKIAEVLRANKGAEAEQGPVASTVNTIAGSTLSLPNMMLAGGMSPASTAGGRAAQGGALGAAGGFLTPVEVDPESGKFWGQKLAQTGLGAGFGAVASPIIGAIGDKLGALVNRFRGTKADPDAIIAKAASESGQKLEDIPEGDLNRIRLQVQRALSEGKNLDAAAALRKADFDAEGIPPTAGMVTRDPMQWAAEQNVRGVKGAGEKVGRLITQGNEGVMQSLGRYSSNAAEPAGASQQLAAALKGYDDKLSGDVRTMYSTAKASAGKDLEIQTPTLLSAYNQAYSDFGDKIPGAIQAKFKALADAPSLTFEDADKLRKVINAHVGSDKPTNTALGILRSAVDNAQEQSVAGGGPFAPAVKLAAERFGQHRELPALAAASSGEVNDRFVQQSVINNPSTPEVKRLAELLRTQSPEAFDQVRQQIGQHLSQAAFGENAAGDKLVRPESYNKALRQLGTGKLEAFFQPDEIEQLKRLGRISSYQVAPPAGAASNYSNTASAIANLLRTAGGFIPVAKGPVQFAGDKLEAAAAMNPKVPVTANLTQEQRLALSRFLLLGSAGGGAALGRSEGQQP